jgi:methyl-accepting chemotaxis protein
VALAHPSPSERTGSLTRPGETAFTAVVNGEGEFVARPDGERIGTEHHGGADAGPIRQGLAGESGFEVIDRGGGGEEMVMGCAPVEGEDWVVMVHEPRSEAFALASLVQ